MEQKIGVLKYEKLIVHTWKNSRKPYNQENKEQLGITWERKHIFTLIYQKNDKRITTLQYIDKKPIGKVANLELFL